MAYWMEPHYPTKYEEMIRARDQADVPSYTQSKKIKIVFEYDGNNMLKIIDNGNEKLYNVDREHPKDIILATVKTNFQ